MNKKKMLIVFGVLLAFTLAASIDWSIPEKFTKPDVLKRITHSVNLMKKNK